MNRRINLKLQFGHWVLIILLLTLVAQGVAETLGLDVHLIWQAISLGGFP